MKKMTTANIFVSVLMIMQLVTALIINSFKPHLDEMFPAITSITGLLVSNQIASVFLPVIIFTALFCAAKKVRVSDFLKLNPISGKNILLIVVMSITIQPAMNILSFISTLFFQNDVGELTLQVLAEIPFWGLVIAMAVVPAVFEELALRGVVLGSYKGELDPKRIIMLNGLFFGMVHLNGQQLLYAAALGSFFAYLVIKTNSIFASMIAHFTINFSQVAMLNFLKAFIDNPDFAALSEPTDLKALEETLFAPGMAEITGMLMSFFLVFLSVYFTCILVALYFSFKKFKEINPPLIPLIPEVTAALSEKNTYTENNVTYITESAPNADSGEAAEIPAEVNELKLAIQKSKRSAVSFYVSLFASVAVYFGYMLIAKPTAPQLLFLIISFTAFFLAFFLFRFRS